MLVVVLDAKENLERTCVEEKGKLRGLDQRWEKEREWRLEQVARSKGGFGYRGG